MQIVRVVDNIRDAAGIAPDGIVSLSKLGIGLKVPIRNNWENQNAEQLSTNSTVGTIERLRRYLLSQASRL